jgi:glyoxylase-like metal-dependent hydrolase (beta-lactamase superfamily II)
LTSTPLRCAYNCPDRLGEGEVATWAPSSSTLISGATEGILIDALLTFNNADEIVAWAKGFGKRITGIYITHGHSDHWLGLARLLEHFLEARGYAAPEVAGRAAWEAEFNKTTKYWTSRFSGELPETPLVHRHWTPASGPLTSRRISQRASNTCATSLRSRTRPPQSRS